jgi:histidine triad (HIT) family protein
MALDPDCIFCKIIDGQIPAEAVYRDENVFAFNDLNPQAPTHVLIVPTLHVENVADLSDASAVVTAALFKAAKAIAAERNLPGYRTVFNTGEAAGQSVFHAHMHLLGGRSFSWPPG